jgi:hypothetical protein
MALDVSGEVTAGAVFEYKEYLSRILQKGEYEKK